MAIDTAMKRFSMLNMATPHVYPRLFEPDGAVDADDRAFLLHLYGGNALEEPVAVTPSRHLGHPFMLLWGLGR